jgi:hypothetical protein
LKKEKHGASFTTLEDILVSNKMLTDAKTMKSDSFFRFTAGTRPDVLPTSANIKQWDHHHRKNCQICTRDLQPILSHILNICIRNKTEMTRRHNKVVGIVRRAIEENMGRDYYRK